MNLTVMVTYLIAVTMMGVSTSNARSVAWSQYHNYGSNVIASNDLDVYMVIPDLLSEFLVYLEIATNHFTVAQSDLPSTKRLSLIHI